MTVVQYKNVSGSTISVPIVADVNGQSQDVADQQVVMVPDDVVMPAEYFVVYP
jgi:hypothetical protein